MSDKVNGVSMAPTMVEGLTYMGPSRIKRHYANKRTAAGDPPYKSIEVAKNGRSVNAIDTGRWRWTKQDINFGLAKILGGEDPFIDPLRGIQVTEPFTSPDGLISYEVGDIALTQGERRSMAGLIYEYILSHARGTNLPKVQVPILVRPDTINSPRTLREVWTGNRGRVELTAYETILMVLDAVEEDKRVNKDKPEENRASRVANVLGLTKQYIGQLLEIAEKMEGDSLLEDALSAYPRPLAVEKALRYAKESQRIGIDFETINENGVEHRVPFIYSKATGSVLTSKGTELKKKPSATKKTTAKKDGKPGEGGTPQTPGSQVSGEKAAVEEASEEDGAVEVNPTSTEDTVGGVTVGAMSEEDFRTAANQSGPPPVPQSAGGPPPVPEAAKEPLDADFMQKMKKALAEAKEEADHETLDEVDGDEDEDGDEDGDGLDGALAFESGIVSKPPKPEGTLNDKETKEVRKGLPFGGRPVEMIRVMTATLQTSDGETLRDLRHQLKDLESRLTVLNTVRVMVTGMQDMLSGEHQKEFYEFLRETWTWGVKKGLFKAE